MKTGPIYTFQHKPSANTFGPKEIFDAFRDMNNVGIMIQVLSLMATHSEVGTGDGNLIRRQILVQYAKKVHTRRFIKPKSRVHAGWLQ